MVLVWRQTLTHFLPEEDVGECAFDIGDLTPDQCVVRKTQVPRSGAVGHPDFERLHVNEKQHLVAMFKQEFVMFLAHETTGSEGMLLSKKYATRLRGLR